MNFSNLADWQQKAAGTLEGVTLYKTVSIGAMSDFSDEQLQVICEAAEVIACECPAHLVDLFRRVRKFRRYTQEDCLVLVPEAAETHHWLSAQMLPLEAALAQVLTEFLQREHLFDEQQQVDLAKLAQRNRQAALRHQEAQCQSQPE
jgi:hypothetical protein